MIRNDTSTPNHFERAEDPTPEQIRQRCRKIREDWSESTRRRRAGYIKRPWTVPVATPLLQSIGEARQN